MGQYKDVDIENLNKVKNRKQEGMGGAKRPPLERKTDKPNPKIWGVEEKAPIFGGSDD
jgi:ribosomal protein L44E